MIESHVHLAYAPRGAGVLYAVLWFAQQRDVYGWYIGSRGGVAEASYFMLPGYYSERGGTLYRSLQDDVYGPWAETRAGRTSGLPHPPVAEPLVHDLARLQDEFVRHWLFFDDEPGNQAEVRALAEHRLPLRHVNGTRDVVETFVKPTRTLPTLEASKAAAAGKITAAERKAEGLSD